MTYQQVEALCEIVGAAKNIGAYDIANVATGLLLDEAISPTWRGEEDVTMILQIETQDFDGEGGPREAYYDLVCLSVWVGGNSPERRISIPVPLLPPTYIATAYKMAMAREADHGNGFEEKKVHAREQQEPYSGEAEALVGRLVRIASADRYNYETDMARWSRWFRAIKEID